MENFNYLDLVIIGVILLSMAISFTRGFAREFFSIVSWIGAIYIAIRFGAVLEPAFTDLIPNESIRLAAANFVVFLGAIILLSIIGNMVASLLQKTALGMIDRLLGVFFGAGRGMVIVTICYFAFSAILHDEKDHPEFVTQAKFLPYLKSGADIIAALIPESQNEDLQNIVDENIEKTVNTLKEGVYDSEGLNQIIRLSE